MKKIKLSIKDFKYLISRIEFLRSQVEELQVVNKRLNEQIREYNQKFTKQKDMNE